MVVDSLQCDLYYLFLGIAQFDRAHRLGRWGRRFESYFRDQYIVIAKLDRAGGVKLSGLGSSPSQYINSSHSSAGRATD